MDFPQKVRDNFYKNEVPYRTDTRDAYHQREMEVVAEFTKDHKEWLKGEGVPEQYVGRVAAKAWDSGHSHGFSEILNESYGLVEIFQLPKAPESTADSVQLSVQVAKDLYISQRGRTATRFEDIPQDSRDRYLKMASWVVLNYDITGYKKR